ncbi:MAG: adenylyltransferase/cytidyltransferase family protein [Clostridiales bacterium]|nr:adenylyltransferase/cytidyltransferase family protein [Clostridiales bacterium]
MNQKKLVPEVLKNETNFSNYVDLLIEMSTDGYCIFMAVMDTPSGSVNFTQEIGAKLCKIGITINLYNKWRVSYCAITDGGQLIAEAGHNVKPSFVCADVGKDEIYCHSVGYAQKGEARSLSIKINNNQVAVVRRGISFVVYDKEKQEILDSVNFDTYTESIPCNRHDISPTARVFVNNNPGVTFITCGLPGFPKENLTDNERYIVESKIVQTFIRVNPTMRSAIQDYIKEPSGIAEVLTPPVSYIGTDGARHFEDCAGKYLNSVNGHRLTTGQPAEFKRTIYIVGDCRFLGIGVRDDGTLASRLQAILNEQASEEGFIVENYAFALDGTDNEKEIIAILNAAQLKSGDIVVGFGEGLHSHNPELDVKPYRHGELFFDDLHFTETTYKLVAEGLFETLKQNNFMREKLSVKQPKRQAVSLNYGLTQQLLSGLEEYKRKLSDIVSGFSNYSGVNIVSGVNSGNVGDAVSGVRDNTIGAIVMNCNPFTLGHRYLIEECAKKVDHLIVFVVQEDKSIFSFADRLELVKAGTADLENVRVVESGSFIISSLTFKEYFNKAELQNRAVDSSNDVTLFANEIAPAAKIKVRFVGSEPFDKVTNQYNRTLERILPQYDIAFEEIPRAKTGGEVISASRVRKLLEIKDFDAIKNLVPDVTFGYLLKKFGSY